jgi:hypothetical protein
MARHFVLNTGAKIPSVGLGTWQADPGVVGDAVYTAVKVRSCSVLQIFSFVYSIQQALFYPFDPEYLILQCCCFSLESPFANT